MSLVVNEGAKPPASVPLINEDEKPPAMEQVVPEENKATIDHGDSKPPAVIHAFNKTTPKAFEMELKPPAEPTNVVISPRRSDLLEPPTTVPGETEDEYAGNLPSDRMYRSADVSTVASETMFITSTQEDQVSAMDSPAGGSELSFPVEDATISDESFKETVVQGLRRASQQGVATPNEENKTGELNSNAFIAVGETMVAQPAGNANDPRIELSKQRTKGILLILPLLFMLMMVVISGWHSNTVSPPLSQIGEEKEIVKTVLQEPMEEYIDLDTLKSDPVVKFDTIYEEDDENVEAEMDIVEGTDDFHAKEGFLHDDSTGHIETLVEEAKDNGDLDFEEAEEQPIESPEEEMDTDSNTEIEDEAGENITGSFGESEQSNGRPEDVDDCRFVFETLEGYLVRLNSLREYLSSLPSFCQILASLVAPGIFIILLLCSALCMCQQGSNIKKEPTPAAMAMDDDEDFPVQDKANSGGPTVEIRDGDDRTYRVDLHNYKYMRCVDLREELRRRSCKVHGRKADLLERLIQNYLEELGSLQYKELQGRLKRAGLKQTGKKDELISRLLEAGL